MEQNREGAIDYLRKNREDLIDKLKAGFSGTENEER